MSQMMQRRTATVPADAAATVARLGHLLPMRELPEEMREALVAVTSEVHLNANETLIAATEQGAYFYVLEGYMILAGAGEQPVRVEAGTPRAELPLFPESTRYKGAVAKAPVKLLRVDADEVARLLDHYRNPQHTDYAVYESSLDDAEAEVIESLFDAYRKRDFELPPMPEIALKVREQASDPDVNVSQLARIAQADAAIAGSLIHAANSAMYAGHRRIENVLDAVTRLGLKSTQNLVFALALRTVFEVDFPQLRQAANLEWQNSVAVSAAAHAIALRTDDLDPERALLAGLMHRVGVIPILGFLQKKGSNPSRESLREILQRLTGPVSVLVISFWEMGADLQAVAEEWADWDRMPEEGADYCDAVQVAVRYCQTLGGEAVDAPPPEDLPAFVRLGLDTIDDRDEVVEEIEASIKVMQSLFLR
ncbi:MAG: HDOD domain-containing protein [Pseudomonadales bacterium]|jgi:HD-like signal output (HDOD) protein|nr:HDOD domain-containing protein [Pseudomonadales bacterium]